MARLTAPRALRPNDDRYGFDCGRELLDRWLRRRAWPNQQADRSRTTVVCDDQNGRVVAYVSVGSGAIDFVPARASSRDRPDLRPVLVLGQLAVDRAYQGRGCARTLLNVVMRTAARSAEDIGGFGVLTFPIDPEARRFFERFGFMDLPFHPAGAMVVRTADLIASTLRT